MSLGESSIAKEGMCMLTDMGVLLPGKHNHYAQMSIQGQLLAKKKVHSLRKGCQLYKAQSKQ